MNESAEISSLDQSTSVAERDHALLALLRYRDFLANDPSKDYLIYLIEMTIVEISRAQDVAPPNGRLSASRKSDGPGKSEDQRRKTPIA